MDHGGRLSGRALERAVIVAAALAIPVLVVDEANIGPGWETTAHWLGWAIWTVFAIEVVVMLAEAVDRRAWVRSHLVDVMIVVLSRPFVPQSLQGARVLWVMRIFRLLHGVDRVAAPARQAGTAARDALLRGAAALSTQPQPRRPPAPATVLSPVARVATTASLAPFWAAGTVLGLFRTTLRVVGSARPLQGERVAELPQGLEPEARVVEVRRARVAPDEVLLEPRPLHGWHDVLEVRRYQLDDVAVGERRRDRATPRV